MVRRLLTKLECQPLREICEESDLTNLVDSVNAERLLNNPRRASREQLVEVLQAARNG